jgi:hypothetical protein
MDDVGFFTSKKVVEFPAAVTRPYRALCDRNLTESGELSNLVIAAAVRDHAMPGALQHSSLLIEDDIFSAVLLISVMN